MALESLYLFRIWMALSLAMGLFQHLKLSVANSVSFPPKMPAQFLSVATLFVCLFFLFLFSRSSVCHTCCHPKVIVSFPFMIYADFLNFPTFYADSCDPFCDGKGCSESILSDKRKQNQQTLRVLGLPLFPFAVFQTWNIVVLLMAIILINTKQTQHWKNDQFSREGQNLRIEGSQTWWYTWAFKPTIEPHQSKDFIKIITLLLIIINVKVI